MKENVNLIARNEVSLDRLKIKLFLSLIVSTVSFAASPDNIINYINTKSKFSYKTIIETTKDTDLILKRKTANMVLEYQRQFDIDQIISYYKEVNSSALKTDKYKSEKKIIYNTIEKYKKVYKASRKNKSKDQLLWALIAYSYEINKFASDPLKLDYFKKCKEKKKSQECLSTLKKNNEVSKVSLKIDSLIRTLSSPELNYKEKKKNIIEIIK